MIPGYRYMDSYPQGPQAHPYHGNHTHYPHHQHFPPGYETIPPTKLDPSKPPVGYEPWSHGCGCYPSQMEYGCCNNMYPPGCYSFRPPHTHPPSYGPVYYHGPHPSFAGMYPAYHAPPAYYSMEQPRYEYDKNMLGEHCCGCPNHRWDQKEGNKGVRIEEHDTATDTKESTPLGPVSVKNNNPFYPFVWIPPEYMKDRDGSKPSELGKKQGRWLPLDMKNGDEMAKYIDPKAWNGWFPNIRSLKEDGDQKKNEDQKSEDTNAHYPFPMIWLPAYEKPDDVEQKECNEQNNKSGEVLKLPPTWKINSMNPAGDEPKKLEDVSRNGVGSEKEAVVKPKGVTLEPKQEEGVKRLPEEMEKPVKNIPVKHIPVKQVQENAKKSSDKSEKRRSPSPPKGSKLPPVCLRIDPFPKRKNGNGSRSSSPGKKAEQPCEDSNARSSQTVKDNAHRDLNVKEPVQSKAQEVPPRKEIKVLDANAKQERQEESHRNHDHSQMQINVPLGKNQEDSRTETEEKRENGKNSMEDKESEEVTAMKSEENKKQKTQLSSTEAAILIQSAYRGFEVRKWEPLKKLRQIGKVREQVADVRKRVDTLETSVELQKDEKQRVFIGETIMALLLQLDTIQGLHQSVRDIRKSVARELVALQEKLDSLPIRKAEEVEAKVMSSIETSVEDTNGAAHGNKLSKETKNDEHSETLCEGVVDGTSDHADSTHEESKELFVTSNSKVDEKSCVDDVDQMNLPEKSIVLPDATADTTGEIGSGEDGQPAIAPANLDDGMKYEDRASDIMAEKSQKAVTSEEPVEAQQNVNEISQTCEVQEKSKKVLESEEPEEAQQNVHDVSRACEELTANEVPKSTELAQVMGMKGDSGVEEVELTLKEEDVGDIGVSTITEESPDANKTTQFDASLMAELPVEVVDEVSPARNPEENPVMEVGNVGSLPVLELADEKTVNEPINVHVDALTLESGDAEVITQEDAELASDTEVESNSTLEGGKAPDINGREVTAVGLSDSDAMQSVPIEEGLECKEVDAGTGEVENEAIVNKASDIDGQMAKSAGVDCSDSIPIEKEPAHEGSDADAAEGEEKVEILNSAPVLEKTVAVASAEDDNRNTVPESELGETKHNILIEENEKLREMVEKLVQAGKQQIEVISNLNGRVKDLEKQLVKKNKHRMRRPRTGGKKIACSKATDNRTKEKLVASAV